MGEFTLFPTASNHVRMVVDCAEREYEVFINGRKFGPGTFGRNNLDLTSVSLSTLDIGARGGTAVDNLRILGWDDPGSRGIAGPVRNPSNQHDYYLVGESSWTATRATALLLGGDLAVLEDSEEEEWIASGFRAAVGISQPLWVGLTDILWPGAYRWVNGAIFDAAEQEPSPEPGAGFAFQSHFPPAYSIAPDITPGVGGVIEMPVTALPTPTPKPPPPPLPDGPGETSLVIVSEPGDPIGDGRTFSYVGNPDWYSVSSSGNDVFVVVTIDHSFFEYWILEFDLPDGWIVGPGEFDNAESAGENVADRPGIQILREDIFPVPTMRGSFEIKEIAWKDQEVVSFWAVFEQFAGDSTSALRGEIRFNAHVPVEPPPTPPPEPTPTPDPTPDPTPTPSPTPTPEPTPVVTPTPRPTVPPVNPTPKPRPNKPAPDKRAPRVTIDGGLSARTTPFDFAILSGRVTDDRRVKKMEIRGGGRVYVRPIRGTDRWYQLVDVKPGRNVFRVRAQDASGNYSKAERIVVTSVSSFQ